MVRGENARRVREWPHETHHRTPPNPRSIASEVPEEQAQSAPAPGEGGNTPPPDDDNGIPLLSRKEVNLLRRASNERWPVVNLDKIITVDRLVETVKHGNRRASTQAAKTLEAMVRSNQADSERAEKYGRIDAGKDTDSVAVTQAVKVIRGVNPEKL